MIGLEDFVRGTKDVQAPVRIPGRAVEHVVFRVPEPQNDTAALTILHRLSQPLALFAGIHFKLILEGTRIEHRSVGMDNERALTVHYRAIGIGERTGTLDSERQPVECNIDRDDSHRQLVLLIGGMIERDVVRGYGAVDILAHLRRIRPLGSSRLQSIGKPRLLIVFGVAVIVGTNDIVV